MKSAAKKAPIGKLAVNILVIAGLCVGNAVSANKGPAPADEKQTPKPRIIRAPRNFPKLAAPACIADPIITNKHPIIMVIFLPTLSPMYPTSWIAHRVPIDTPLLIVLSLFPCGLLKCSSKLASFAN